MKIGIVTWFHHKNYGTILQAYALQKFLKNNGYDCSMVNYIPTVKKKNNRKIKYKQFKKKNYIQNRAL